ncbi:D-Ala-D-Ala carboxypeptidase family metallohydrolase [Nodosilinea sp. PGN35]|uniref:D-Ala-D-Ala carboxypeptidase family metallohydrolase n=1 Tax=Nodosilinea sp. PGN35 TaxID=3020489 RepID=UPI0023B3049F|nr:D-Ala-D-Ala carboxypeptidase family metallohydrolase [Nodosilinea sp. TSF1-S3]MDF0370258.1 D-Ala-D-Ala carboxypeptidase family metallohydrolase [Nodosilinea sp. TSF1-S3]
MGTWVKETDEAFYLMQGNQWISRIQKRPSANNPREQVLNVEGMRDWFLRSDAPLAMTVSVGTGGPEPEQAGSSGGGTPPPVEVIPPPGGETPPPEGGGPGSGGNPAPGPAKSLTLRVKSTTYFKLQPRLASELADAEKVLVTNGTTFDIQYYIDVGKNHWQVQLLEPSLGNKTNRTWFVYTPDIDVLTGIRLRVVSDTLFKTEPKISSQLSESQKVFVKNGTQLNLLAFKPAAGDHHEIELADAIVGAEVNTKWYVYSPDAKIDGNRQTLEVTGDTIFKAQPLQANQLADADKVLVKKGTVFLLNSYAQPDKNHVRVALQGAFLGPQNRTTWFAYVPDIQISGTELGNRPGDQGPGQPTNPADRGVPLTFPGFTGTYYSNDPIQPKNRYGVRGHFTWGEALHVNRSTGAYRRPANSGVVYNILKVADVMEEIRKMYGDKPLQINSWYRDPATNAAVGGASMSRHLSGDAVDFVVPGVRCFDVYARLNGWWGSRGGLASSSVFTHIDVRGYRARWSYGY